MTSLPRGLRRLVAKALKKNKRMLRYKGGSRGHMQEKETWEKSSMGQGVKTQR
jgi:hypothetical protein